VLFLNPSIKYPSGLGQFRSLLTLLCGALLLLSLATSPVVAQSASWAASPGTGDWNTAGNWTPANVPNGTADVATFGSSSITAISLSASTEVSSITFNSGASAFTITSAPTFTLTLSGTGITNNLGITQNFVTATNGVGSAGTVVFTNSATAGSQTLFTNNGGTVFEGDGGRTIFRDNSTAGSGTFTNNGATVSDAYSGRMEFRNSSTAASGTFTNNGGAGSDSYGAYIEFFDTSRAGSGTFINNGGTASNATGGCTIFIGTSTADNGTFIANGGTVNGAGGGITQIGGNSTAGSSTLIANGGTGGGDGGSIQIYNDSTGGTAIVRVYGNGNLDISGRYASGVTIGSVEGTGKVFLGAWNLTVGSNNLSTTFSGVMQDGGSGAGTGGSLTKTGSGTLTLSGANTYTGGTTISAGTIFANNASGSVFGTGPVTVASGATLGGSGFIGGLATVAGGGHLAPGNSPGTLTFTNGLTLASGAVLDFQLGTVSDLIAVTGGTLAGPSGTGGITLNLSNSGGFVPGTPYTLFNFVSGQTNSFDVTDFTFGTLIGTTSGSDYSYSLTSTSLALTYNGSLSAVPEPSTYAALLGLGALGFAAWRRRKAQAKD